MTTLSRKDVFFAIEQERDYQDKKWGTLDDHPHEVGAWLTIMRQFVNDAERAYTGQCGDKGALDELRKAVAVGVACLEQHGVPPRYREESAATMDRSENTTAAISKAIFDVMCSSNPGADSYWTEGATALAVAAIRHVTVLNDEQLHAVLPEIGFGSRELMALQLMLQRNLDVVPDCVGADKTSRGLECVDQPECATRQ